MKKFLLLRLKDETRVIGGCSPDDPDFIYEVTDCFENTGKYFEDKEEAIKKAKEKNSETELYGVIEIYIP